MTIDDPPTQAVDEIKVVKGAARRRGNSRAGGGAERRTGGRVEPGPQELNLWGHPVDKLRFSPSAGSW